MVNTKRPTRLLIIDASLIYNAMVGSNAVPCIQMRITEDASIEVSIRRFNQLDQLVSHQTALVCLLKTPYLKTLKMISLRVLLPKLKRN